MPKMATKKTNSRRRLPLFNIGAMQAKAKADVITYRDIVDQIGYLINNHPEVQQRFLIDTLLDKFAVTEEWFTDMQEHHKQSIIDSVRGRHE